MAAELARLTGRTKTEAVTEALRDRLQRVGRERRGCSLADELDEIGRRCARLPVQDARPADEILGCDEHGVTPPSASADTQDEELVAVER